VGPDRAEATAILFPLESPAARARIGSAWQLEMRPAAVSVAGRALELPVKKQNPLRGNRVGRKLEG
jgi:hypothetical protein